MDGDKNHVKKEDDLSCFDDLIDLEGDEIFSKFINQNPVDFSELEQYTDDEMSSIFMQEMDDSVNAPVPPTLPTPSTVEIPPDCKKPRKKKSRSALEESAVLNPRRSKRIMLRRASATKSENTRRLEEYLLEYRGRSSHAQTRARAAESATLEMVTKDLRDERTESKKLPKTMANQIHRQKARNEDVKLGIQWLKMMASHPTMASMPFAFDSGNYADLLPNPQGHQLLAEAPPGFAGASSSSAAGGGDAVPRCTANVHHFPGGSSVNNGLAEGSGKPADFGTH